MLSNHNSSADLIKANTCQYSKEASKWVFYQLENQKFVCPLCYFICLDAQLSIKAVQAGGGVLQGCECHKHKSLEIVGQHLLLELVFKQSDQAKQIIIINDYFATTLKTGSNLVELNWQKELNVLREGFGFLSWDDLDIKAIEQVSNMVNFFNRDYQLEHLQALDILALERLLPFDLICRILGCPEYSFGLKIYNTTLNLHTWLLKHFLTYYFERQASCLHIMDTHNLKYCGPGDRIQIRLFNKSNFQLLSNTKYKNFRLVSFAQSCLTNFIPKVATRWVGGTHKAHLYSVQLVYNLFIFGLLTSEEADQMVEVLHQKIGNLKALEQNIQKDSEKINTFWVCQWREQMAAIRQLYCEIVLQYIFLKFDQIFYGSQEQVSRLLSQFFESKHAQMLIEILLSYILYQSRILEESLITPTTQWLAKEALSFFFSCYDSYLPGLRRHYKCIEAKSLQLDKFEDGLTQLIGQYFVQKTLAYDQVGVLRSLKILLKTQPYIYPQFSLRSLPRLINVCSLFMEEIVADSQQKVGDEEDKNNEQLIVIILRALLYSLRSDTVFVGFQRTFKFIESLLYVFPAQTLQYFIIPLLTQEGNRESDGQLQQQQQQQLPISAVGGLQSQFLINSSLFQLVFEFFKKKAIGQFTLSNQQNVTEMDQQTCNIFSICLEILGHFAEFVFLQQFTNSTDLVTPPLNFDQEVSSILTEFFPLFINKKELVTLIHKEFTKSLQQRDQILVNSNNNSVACGGQSSETQPKLKLILSFLKTICKSCEGKIHDSTLTQVHQVFSMEFLEQLIDSCGDNLDFKKVFMEIIYIFHINFKENLVDQRSKYFIEQLSGEELGGVEDIFAEADYPRILGILQKEMEVNNYVYKDNYVYIAVCKLSQYFLRAEGPEIYKISKYCDCFEKFFFKMEQQAGSEMPAMVAELQKCRNNGKKILQICKFLTQIFQKTINLDKLVLVRRMQLLPGKQRSYGSLQYLSDSTQGRNTFLVQLKKSLPPNLAQKGQVDVSKKQEIEGVQCSYLYFKACMQSQGFHLEQQLHSEQLETQKQYKQKFNMIQDQQQKKEEGQCGFRITTILPHLDNLCFFLLEALSQENTNLIQSAWEQSAQAQTAQIQSTPKNSASAQAQTALSFSLSASTQKRQCTEILINLLFRGERVVQAALYNVALNSEKKFQFFEHQWQTMRQSFNLIKFKGQHDTLYFESCQQFSLLCSFFKLLVKKNGFEWRLLLGQETTTSIATLSPRGSAHSDRIKQHLLSNSKVGQEDDEVNNDNSAAHISQTYLQSIGFDLNLFTARTRITANNINPSFLDLIQLCRLAITDSAENKFQIYQTFLDDKYNQLLNALPEGVHHSSSEVDSSFQLHFNLVQILLEFIKDDDQIILEFFAQHISSPLIEQIIIWNLLMWLTSNAQGNTQVSTQGLGSSNSHNNFQQLQQAAVIEFQSNKTDIPGSSQVSQSQQAATLLTLDRLRKQFSQSSQTARTPSIKHLDLAFATYLLGMKLQTKRALMPQLCYSLGPQFLEKFLEIRIFLKEISLVIDYQGIRGYKISTVRLHKPILLTKRTKLQFLHDAALSITSGKKVSSKVFYQWLPILQEEIQANNKAGYFALVERYTSFVEILIVIMLAIINIMLLNDITDSNSDIYKGRFYKACIVLMSIVMISSFFMSVAYFIFCFKLEVKKAFYLHFSKKLATSVQEKLVGGCCEDSTQNNSSFLVKAKIYLLDGFIFNDVAGPFFWYFVFSWLAFFLSSFFYGASFIIVLHRFKSTRDLVSSVLNIGCKLVAVFAVVLVFIYCYSFLARTSFDNNFNTNYVPTTIQNSQNIKEGNQSTNNFCTSLVQCFWQSIDFGLRKGIADIMKRQLFTDSNYGYFYERLIFDVSFYLIVNLLFVALVTALLVSAIKEDNKRRNALQKVLNEQCLICGVHRSAIEIIGASNFEDHVMNQHNIWNYMQFIITLKEFSDDHDFFWENDKEELTHIKCKIQNQDGSWLPYQFYELLYNSR